MEYAVVEDKEPPPLGEILKRMGWNTLGGVHVSVVG
jgi:hypothetical protein